MTAATSGLRPTIYQLRLCAGLILGLYVIMHLGNHALGLISVSAQEAARPWVMALWHSWLGQLLLYGSLVLHIVLGLQALAQRRYWRVPAWQVAQILLGLAIPYFLLLHVVNTRGTRILTGIDIDYVYEITMLWVDPWSRARQVTLVLLVWTHFSVGIHFWLRLRAGYRRVFPVVLLAYVLLPVCALLGFAQVGMDMADHALADPKWYAAVQAHGKPADPGRAQLRVQLKAWVGPAWLGLVGLVFVAARIRDWRALRSSFGVTYHYDQQLVRAPVGMSLLEVSRRAGRPHMAVCGGRARCTTCRVRILRNDGDLPTPTPAEAHALRLIDAPPSLRLACQTRPACDLEIQPVLQANVQLPIAPAAPGTGGPVTAGADFGSEREVTVLFVDVRGSTRLAENRMPYDVVFLINQFMAEMAAAVEATGGHYSNFTGDGLMAIFGLASPSASSSGRDCGARAALFCAAEMLERVARINDRLACELAAPLSVGIGIHTGLAIVGRMGPPKMPIVTALGDTVNAAARIEHITKDLGAPVVASARTMELAELKEKMRRVRVRGRDAELRVATFEDATAIRRRLGESPTFVGRAG